MIVYPNPASAHVSIHIPESATGHLLQVFDFTGKEIFSETVKFQNLNLNTENWDPGIYLVKVESCTGNYSSTINKY